MIDTDKYEGHAEGPWKIESYNQGQAFTGIDFNMTHTEKSHLAMKNGREKEREATVNLIADAPLLLEEVKRLRKLEAAVVGSWMRACDHRGPWHKALRYPCVELGYLTLDGHYFELSEEYQDMAKAWIREQNGDDEE